MTDDLILKALDFASEAHKNDKRKYTGEPYIFHPIEVSQIVASVLPDDYEAQAAALLHDTVEDTHVTLEDIFDNFGKRIADLVWKVTKASEKKDGNRAVRKEMDRVHYSENGCSASQTIKLADVISNSADVADHDPGFAKTYLVEQEALVLSLTDGHPVLRNAAIEAVTNAKESLK